MRWPWVSRIAYDLLLDERDRLRAKNDNWEDHVRRVKRKEKGMTELPAEKKVPLEPIPGEIERIIQKFGSEATRQGVRNNVLMARHRQGQPWSKIQQTLENSLD